MRVNINHRILPIRVGDCLFILVHVVYYISPRWSAYGAVDYFYTQLGTSASTAYSTVKKGKISRLNKLAP